MRPANLQRSAQPGRNRGLCYTHYEADPNRGYVDPEPARTHLQTLRDRGVTLKMMAGHGLSRMGCVAVETAERIRRETEAKVLAIPIPAGRVASGTDVDGTGTRRRLQGLMALGWSQSKLAADLGTTQTAVSALTRRDWVTAATAEKVRVLFDQLCMLVGPSDISRQRALAKGWVPPLGWDDIDDPDETPSTGPQAAVFFPERYQELADLNLTRNEIANKLGVLPESLARQLARHGMAA